MSDPLPPLPQEYYEENRTRFNADTSFIDVSSLSARCSHVMKRVSAISVECTICHAGWIDMGRFKGIQNID